MQCPVCKGSGKRPGEPNPWLPNYCPACKGTGYANAPAAPAQPKPAAARPERPSLVAAKKQVQAGKGERPSLLDAMKQASAAPERPSLAAAVKARSGGGEGEAGMQRMPCPICRGVKRPGCPVCDGKGYLEVKTKKRTLSISNQPWERSSLLGRLDGKQFILFAVLLVLGIATAGSDIYSFLSSSLSLIEIICHIVFWVAIYLAMKGLSLHENSHVRWLGMIFIAVALAGKMFGVFGSGGGDAPSPEPDRPAATARAEP